MSKSGDKKRPELAGFLVDALRDREAQWSDKLARLSVNALLERRVDELVDAETLSAALSAALEPEAVKQAVERVAVPAWSRERQRAKACNDKPKNFLTPSAKADLLAALGQPVRYSPGVVREIANAPAVRALLGALIQETLIDFVSRAPIPGLSTAMNLMSRVGRKIESQTERHVKDFLDKSMARITARTAELISTDANRAGLGQLRAAVVSQALDRPLDAYYDRLSKGMDILAKHLPGLIAHNMARPEIKNAVDEELRILVAQEGAQTAAELLSRLGALEKARDLAVDTAKKAIFQVTATEGFADWLENLVESVRTE